MKTRILLVSTCLLALAFFGVRGSALAAPPVNLGNVPHGGPEDPRSRAAALLELKAKLDLTDLQVAKIDRIIQSGMDSTGKKDIAKWRQVDKQKEDILQTLAPTQRTKENDLFVERIMPRLLMPASGDSTFRRYRLGMPNDLTLHRSQDSALHIGPEEETVAAEMMPQAYSQGKKIAPAKKKAAPKNDIPSLPPAPKVRKAKVKVKAPATAPVEPNLEVTPK